MSELEDDGLSSESDSVFDESDIESGSPGVIPSSEYSPLATIPQSPPAKTPPPKSPRLFPRLLGSTSIVSGRREKEESLTESGTSSTSVSAPSRGPSTDYLSPKPVKPTMTRNTSESASSTRRIPRPKFNRGRNRKSDYELSADSDVVGIVMLEIDKAEDLPKVKNSESAFLCYCWLVVS